MWPVLTPAQLLHDLFGSTALVRSAGRGVLDAAEVGRLVRPRSDTVDEVPWTDADVPLLDEARALLGPRPGRREDEHPRTYGHIVVDEAQDLSPMQLRMIARRSLNGSMTVVGDIAQATGAWAPDTWDDVLAHLPERKGRRTAELTIGYRIPAQAMTLAARVLKVAAPDLRPPTSVREGDVPPRIVGTTPDDLLSRVAELAGSERVAVGAGNVAIVGPGSMTEQLVDALEAGGVPHGRADHQALDDQVNVVPVGLVKGLELDAVVVVEPARIVEEEPQGMRALYVALTRATQRLTIVHSRPLPEALSE
jgi:DNA helicase IV